MRISRLYTKIPFWIALIGLSFGTFAVHGQVSLGNYTLQDTRSGKMMKFSEFENKKVVVLVFTSADCAFSMKYQDRINAMNETYKDQSVAFVAVNSNDSALNAGDAVKRMRIQVPYKFPYIKDASQEIAEVLEATRNPEAFVLVPLGGGKFEIVYRGQIDDNPLDAAFVEKHFVKDAIEAVLAGDRPAVKQTEATGCNIKWQKS